MVGVLMHGLIHRSVVVAGAAAALLVPVLAVAGPAAALPSNCSQSGSTVTCTFSATGSASWTVPPGVSRATFTVDGAAGGGGANVDASGGLGGQVSAALTALSSGQVFTVSVGGAGQAHVHLTLALAGSTAAAAHSRAAAAAAASARSRSVRR